MNLLNRLYSWYGKRVVVAVAAIVVILVGVGIFAHFALQNANTEEGTQENLPLVTVVDIKNLSGESAFRVTGTVSAISEARLQTEAGGRITSVNVSLGDFVNAGTVLATLENSAQRAALLQAEGAYEAALAGAASSQSGTESAETALSSARSNAVNAYRSAFIDTDNVVRSTIDDLFTDPTGTIPGFRIEAYGQAVTYNTERSSLEGILDTWSVESSSITPSNVSSEIPQAIEYVTRILSFTEMLSDTVARQDVTSSFTQGQKDTLVSEFVSARSSLNATLQALQGAQTNIRSASEALDRAVIAGSGTTVSLSDAQVKSALGSLRAAQSNYEKTLVRTPISGVVNALYLKAGEYASPSQNAAIIANNNALEIATYVTENESSRIQVDDSVILDDSYTGTITEIAPAIDPVTGKIAIKIQAESSELTNGKVVGVEFQQSEDIESTQSDTPIIIPITALKVETDRIVVFTVSEEGTLIAHKIVEGPLIGDSIVIVEGIDASMQIVVDARGLNEGDSVEVASQN